MPRKAKGQSAAQTLVTREKRIVNKPSTYDPDIGKWSKEEKEKFLDALKKHGCLNVQKLQKEVGSKSEDSVRIFLNNCGKNSRYLLNKKMEKKGKSPQCFKICHLCRKYKKTFKARVTDEAVDKWLELMHDAEPVGYNETKTLPIARSFLFLSEFEEHPDPKKCNGVDFKALYENLYYMLSGLPGKRLNKETVDFFERSIDDLTQFILSPPLSDKSDMLEEMTRICYQPVRGVRKYPGKKVDSSLQENALLDLQGYNPLRIPQDFLKFAYQPFT